MKMVQAIMLSICVVLALTSQSNNATGVTSAETTASAEQMLDEHYDHVFTTPLTITVGMRTSWRGLTILLQNDLTVQGELLLDDANIVVDGKSTAVKLTVMYGGFLSVHGSNITKTKDGPSYSIIVGTFSTMFVEESTISGLGENGLHFYGDQMIFNQSNLEASTTGLVGSGRVIVENSHFMNIDTYGLDLSSVNELALTNITFSDNGVGLRLVGTKAVKLTNNWFMGNGQALVARSSTNFTLKSNNFQSSEVFDVTIEASTRVNITQNTFQGSAGVILRVEDSTHISLTFNSLLGDNRGIVLAGKTSGIVQSNDFNTSGASLEIEEEGDMTLLLVKLNNFYNYSEVVQRAKVTNQSTTLSFNYYKRHALLLKDIDLDGIADRPLVGNGWKDLYPLTLPTYYYKTEQDNNSNNFVNDIHLASPYANPLAMDPRVAVGPNIHLIFVLTYYTLFFVMAPVMGRWVIKKKAQS